MNKEIYNVHPYLVEKAEARKKPYVRPSFRHEVVFETNALTCGKTNPTQGSCKTVKKNS